MVFLYDKKFISPLTRSPNNAYRKVHLFVSGKLRTEEKKMERSQIYYGGLTAEQFLFPEIRICARLYLEGKDSTAALAVIREGNLF